MKEQMKIIFKGEREKKKHCLSPKYTKLKLTPQAHKLNLKGECESRKGPSPHLSLLCLIPVACPPKQTFQQFCPDTNKDQVVAGISSASLLTLVGQVLLAVGYVPP